MSRSTITAALRRVLGLTFTPPIRTSRDRNRFRPTLERFEDRALPAGTMSVMAGTNVTEGGLTSFVLSRTDTTTAQSASFSFGGTAGGMDYVQPLMAYFDVGVGSITLSVATNDDTESEPTETITLNIGSGSGYTVGTPGSATVYLYDNGSASAAVSVAGVADTYEGGTPGVLRFSRTGDASAALTVGYSVGGTATSGSDYAALSGSVTFAAGATYADVLVTSYADNLTEGTETVVATVASGTGYAVGTPADGTVHITYAPNIPPTSPPVVSVEVLDDAYEGGSGGLLRFTRTGGDLSASLTVGYAVSGTATSGTDFTALSGSVTFAADEDTVDVSIATLDDTSADPNEYLTATLTSSMNYSTGTFASATVRLVDDDSQLVTVTRIADAIEGGAAGGVRFTRTGDTSQSLTVTYTVSGTATAGTDYTALSGSVTIPAGASFADVAVTATSSVSRVGSGTASLIVSVAVSANYQVDPNAYDVVQIAHLDGGPGEIGGTVWNDDGDGIRQTGETLVAGSPVTILDADGNALFVTLTDANGAYLFRGLPLGTYLIKFIPMLGQWYAPIGLGSTPANNNTVGPDDIGLSVPIVLTTTKPTDLILGPGFIPFAVPAAPADIVFDLDVNANGTLTDPVDLAKNYLPGYNGSTAKVSTGTKFSDQTYAGQKMKLIFTAGTDLNTLTKIEFKIITTSKRAGYSSNTTAAAVTGQGKEKDYAFDKLVDLDTITVTRTSTPATDDKGGKMEAGYTWAYFWCKDYGGSCTVEAKVYTDDGTGEKSTTHKLRVPLDEAENQGIGDGIADKWQAAMAVRWKAQYGTAAPQGSFNPTLDAEEQDPDGAGKKYVAQKTTGDKHTVFEEYRGYILDGGGADGNGTTTFNGGHLRLDPARKEILVEVDHEQNYGTLPTGASIDSLMVGASTVFSQKDRGAGIYMYYLVDASNLNIPADNIKTNNGLFGELKKSRDTVAARTDMKPNLATDFVHFVFVDTSDLAFAARSTGLPANAPANSDVSGIGSMLAVDDTIAAYRLLGIANDKMAEALSVTIAHEITHLMYREVTDPFDENRHTTKEKTDLMYKLTLLENRAFATVKFTEALQRELDPTMSIYLPDTPR